MFASGLERNPYRLYSHQHGTETGYVLLSLLLFVSVLVIAAAVAAPKIAFSVRREREQELIHRGVQYTRAIRAFYKKFGRYPTNLEELQSANGQRFLRKQYTDPITGKGFKLLRLADVQFSDGARTVVFTQSAPDTTEPDAAAANDGTDTPPASPQDPNAQAVIATAQESPSVNPQSKSSNPRSAAKPTPTPDDASALLGGGPIVGVASESKQRSIREFSHKSHYNDWKFYFDSGYDSGTINGPTVRAAMPAAPLNQGQGTKGN